MHDAFVALNVANNLLDQVFVYQVSVHCIEYQEKLLMSSTNANRVSHFSPSQNTPFGSHGTEHCKANIPIWVFLFESSI